MTIRLVVGLGNPGPRYAATRHNAGFWLVDQLAQDTSSTFRTESRFTAEIARLRLEQSADVWLLKPQTFMNRSGLAVQKVAAYYRIPPEAILIVHDDLDLPPGVARLKRGGGHGGHNGLRDLHQHLGANYARLRIGIGHPGQREAVINYVLEPPRQSEFAAIMEALSAALSVIHPLITGDWDKAVRTLHSQSKPEQETQA